MILLDLRIRVASDQGRESIIASARARRQGKVQLGKRIEFQLWASIIDRIRQGCSSNLWSLQQRPTRIICDRSQV
jgi:hypothetical protein